MPSASSRLPGQPVFQLRVCLEDIDPVIWRRLLVPGSVRLAKLHDMFQAAMGWTDSHLHAFRIGGELFGMRFDEWDDDEIDEKGVTILRAIGDQRRFLYDYDFGDSWSHEVAVEDFRRLPIGLKHAVCLDGQNSCPPEDCGGTGGYALLLEALADQSHDEHDEYVTWVGESFDPSTFDLALANAALQRVR